MQTQDLIANIENEESTGMTNIYLATSEALNILKTEDMDKYNLSIILMTDGLSNKGNFYDVKNYTQTLEEIFLYIV